MPDPKDSLQEGDALLLVDIQKDFCPGGALPIEEGDKIVPFVNGWIEAAREKGYPVYASRDWHPAHHMSFEEQGGKWPPHCIQDSDGAKFHPDLILPDTVEKITKGVRFDQDQNSVFDQTGLSVQLRRDGVGRLWSWFRCRTRCVPSWWKSIDRISVTKSRSSSRDCSVRSRNSSIRSFPTFPSC